MQRLVRLKHYAVFLLVFIAPISIFVLLVTLITSLNIPTLNAIGPMSLFSLIIGWFVWMYSSGVMLYEKIPVSSCMSLKRFKIFLFAPCIFFLCLLGSLTYFTRISNANTQSPTETIVMFAMAFGFLFSIFCVLYCFYFIAKCLKSIQYQRAVSFKEYAGEFFLFWILPVGIWVLQPKINKVFSKEEYELGSDVVFKD